MSGGARGITRREAMTLNKHTLRGNAAVCDLVRYRSINLHSHTRFSLGIEAGMYERLFRTLMGR